MIEINKKYEITYPNGTVSRIKVIKLKRSNIGCDDYLFQYVGEPYGIVLEPSHINDNMENTFYFPEPYVEMLKIKEL